MAGILVYADATGAPTKERPGSSVVGERSTQLRAAWTTVTVLDPDPLSVTVVSPLPTS